MQMRIEAAGLPDKRLRDRLEKMVEEMGKSPHRSLPEIFGTWGETKAAYRFLSNERVTHEELVKGQAAETYQRIASRGESVVLLVQDSTEFDFSHHRATEGMGRLENEHMNGFVVHSTLAVSGEGVPLGLVEQQVWVREDQTLGQRHQRHKRPFEEKESYKWVRGLPERNASESTNRWITVCDREADIYMLFEAALSRGMDFVVRATRERDLDGGEVKLFAHIRQLPVQQTYTLMLSRRPERDPRHATVELRYDSLTLNAPQHAHPAEKILTVQVVEVYEPHPPQGETAVHWILLTSLPVASPAQAQQVVAWYLCRWLIERFHYVLKSGCRLEERQLRDRSRLERLLGLFNLVAWNLLWLTYQARQTPDASCLTALSTHEWQALYGYIHHTDQLPASPPSLHAATRWIAQLGGFLGRKGDGDPGVKVLWRGWQRLHDIVTAYQTFSPLSHDVGNA
jgi:hypothetical protein